MRKAAYLICSIALLCGCSHHLSKKEVKECGEAAYADLVSFIAAGFQRQWNEMSPEEMDLSPEYRHCSPYAGFARTDIDGDGFPELLLGEQFEDGSYCLYDIFGINKKDASLIHLAGGGENNSFTIGTDGRILEIPVTPDPISVTPDPIRGPSNERDSGTKSGMTSTVTPDQSTVTPDPIRGPSNEGDAESMELRLEKFKDYQ